MNVAMVASEANPLCKTGGLADVVWSLTKELTKLQQNAYVILPFYKCIKENPTIVFEKVDSYDVYLSWRRQSADVFRCVVRGVTFFLVGNDYYFNRENLYGYEDDGERFAFFVLAARSLFGHLGIRPDVIHVHDWQTAMLPVLIKEQSQLDPTFRGTRFVLTLHNEAFKGYLDRYFVNHFFGLDDGLYDSGKLRFDGQLSTLKAGIVYADKVVAVSPNHAAELLDPNNPLRLGGVLQSRRDDFLGIVNGVDTEEFDASTDMFIAQNFTAKTFEDGKATCKHRLLQVCNLEDDDTPVFGLVSRLTFQKGIELAIRLSEQLLEGDAKVIILGSGEEGLENRIEDLRSRFPTRCAIYRGYNNQLAHDIYAGSDFFLMPSLFEPCGIGQMIAQRYGCLPIVRSTGGLKDTVTGYDGHNEDEANGFAFEDYDLSAFEHAVETALNVYSEPHLRRKLVMNAMTVDHSWRRSAKEYLALYRSLS